MSRKREDWEDSVRRLEITKSPGLGGQVVIDLEELELGLQEGTRA